MAQTNRDLRLRAQIIDLFKDFRARKINDEEIIDNVMGVLGVSERVVKSHFKGWKAQKKLKSFVRLTRKQKIDEILKND